MVLPTVLHLPCIITSFLTLMAKSQCNINGVVCAADETGGTSLHVFECGYR